MKIKGIDFNQGKLTVTGSNGEYFLFELNADQMILLLQQIVTAIWFSFTLVPRD